MRCFLAAAILLLCGNGYAAEEAVSKCDRCHSVRGWQPARFNHSKTDFALKGAHQRVPCRACHPGGVYEKRTDRSCASCHLDVHAGQLGRFCETCHDETTWKGLYSADSHRRTNFPLTGRHALIPCEECHLPTRDKTFSRAALACVACHEADYNATAAKSVDHAALGFSKDCRQCHNPGRFKPARFADHDRCFPISAGSHSGFTCTDCHSSVAGLSFSGSCTSIGNATCTGCHTGAHAQARTDPRHASVAGYQYKDQKCLECHHAP
jgi:hypothetical protein